MFQITLKNLIFYLLGVSVIFFFMSKTKKGNEIFGEIKLFSTTRRNETNEVFVIAICRDNSSETEEKYQRQMDQAYVLLKSAALLTKKILRFIVMVEEKKTFNDILARIENWPEGIRYKLNLEKGKVWYPESANMRHLFRVCATERLFLHQALPSEDSVVFLDTDIIFLKPPEEMWKEFSKFDSIQVSGLSPCLYYYDTSHMDFPFYGKTGINAGVWMMNLTRMRSFPGGWTNTCINIYKEYKKHIYLADQDIANIIFNKNSKLLYELPCQWNYRDNICNVNSHPCKGVEESGIYLLHGSDLTFHKDHNQKMKVMYKEFLNFDVERPLEDLLQSIKTSLKNGGKPWKKSPSRCTNFPHYDEMLTKNLEKSIQSSN